MSQVIFIFFVLEKQACTSELTRLKWSERACACVLRGPFSLRLLARSLADSLMQGTDGRRRTADRPSHRERERERERGRKTARVDYS